jgi:hypothetical protein
VAEIATVNAIVPTAWTQMTATIPIYAGLAERVDAGGPLPHVGAWNADQIAAQWDTTFESALQPSGVSLPPLELDASPPA